MDETLLLRLRVEDLLYLEADLLDRWQLDDWLALYAEDAHYYVPPNDVDGDTAEPETSLFYIMDDAVRMKERVIRLSKIGAHSEHHTPRCGISFQTPACGARGTRSMRGPRSRSGATRT